PPEIGDRTLDGRVTNQECTDAYEDTGRSHGDLLTRQNLTLVSSAVNSTRPCKLPPSHTRIRVSDNRVKSGVLRRIKARIEQGEWRSWVLPSAEPDDGLGGNLETLLWMDRAHVFHPRMRVLDIQDAPRERPSDHHIEPATDGDAGSILGVLDRVIASLGIVRARAISIVPFLQQL